MQVPLELSYHGMPRIGWVDDYVKERVERLDRMADDIISCRVAIEQEQNSKHTGNLYRARVEVTLPQKKDLVANKHGAVEDLDVQLRPIIRETFEAVEKQIKKETSRRRDGARLQEEQGQAEALVVRIFAEEGYGFIKSPVDGEEHYFHRNAVLHDDFKRLTPGTQVRFESEMGEMGPQASSVQIVDKPGVRAGQTDDETIQQPAGWEKS